MDLEKKKNLQGLLFTLPALLWTALFFVVPVSLMVINSFWRRVGDNTIREWTLENYQNFLANDALREALANSLEVTVLVTLISILLAYPLAYILAYRVSPRWQSLALLMAVLPFWTSYVVRSYSWLLVLSETGIISRFLQILHFIDSPVSLANSRTGTIIGFVHFFIMLLTLTIFSSLNQIPSNYRLAGSDLGASVWQVFLRITLPLSLPGVAVGAFLTFVLCIGDYITPQILGGNVELLLPQAIMLQVSRRANFPMASALSMVLVFLITVLFIFNAKRLRSLGR
jgi:spermidine/putrescine transport system permease protein